MIVTLVTGSSTGIGEETALLLARKGHHVFASMRTPETGGVRLREKAAVEGLKLETVALDVDELASVERCVAAILARTGRIDVLVNNAGISRTGAVEETSDEALKAIFETNFFGAWRMMRAVLPGMRERRYGSIVNVTSMAGRVAAACMGSYAASKWALEAASEALAQEVYRFNIRVSVIEPGVILTPILRKASPVNPASPYAEFPQRMGPLLAKLVENHQEKPSVVAEAIYHAIMTEHPVLRYPVGAPAATYIAARAAMADEDWVALGRPMEGEEVAHTYKRFGFPP